MFIQNETLTIVQIAKRIQRSSRTVRDSLKRYGVEPALKSRPYVYTGESLAGVKFHPDRTAEQEAELQKQRMARALWASKASARKRAARREGGQDANAPSPSSLGIAESARPASDRTQSADPHRGNSIW